jgi:type II secretory pathway pseudopilin PulG
MIRIPLIQRQRGGAHGKDAGFTLLEAVTGVVLAVSVMAFATSSLATTRNVLSQATSMADVEASAQRAANAIMIELRQSGSPASGSGLAVDEDTSTPRNLTNRVTFRKNAGFDDVAGTVVWSDPIEFAFEYDARESGNGRDDDGDGLVDEGRIVRRDFAPDGTTRTKVIATSVFDTVSFAIEPGGKAVILVLETGAVLDKQSVRRHRVEERVSLRN